MASALETLCGQAYGAGQYAKLSTYTYGAIISLIMVCFPISILWIYIDKLLILLGQDPLISAEAPVLVIHVPVCWALVFKLGLSNAGATLAIGISYTLNVIILGIYMYRSKDCENTRVTCSGDVVPSIKEFFHFGIPSAALICLEWWSYEIVILLSGLLPNPQLETSVLSICLTISTLHYFIPYSLGAAARNSAINEKVYLIQADQPRNGRDVVSKHQRSFSTSETYPQPELANGIKGHESDAAKVVLLAVFVLGAMEVIIASATLFCFRSVLGYAFGNEKELVDYVKEITLLICFSISADTVQAILSVASMSMVGHLGELELAGTAVATSLTNVTASSLSSSYTSHLLVAHSYPFPLRHTPVDHKELLEGAGGNILYINLGSYYLAGIPMALILGFVVLLKGVGLWCGLIIGSVAQCILLTLVRYFINWEKQATMARERMLKDENSLEE
ncbi:MATE efflux family protein [Tanacetum coccineum]